MEEVMEVTEGTMVIMDTSPAEAMEATVGEEARLPNERPNESAAPSTSSASTQNPRKEVKMPILTLSTLLIM